MATHGVWQLKQVTIRYCQHSGSSRFIRQMLGDQRFLSFVQENPQVTFRTELKGARHPVLIGDYISDAQKVCDVKNQEVDFVMMQLERLRNTSGRKMTRMNRPVLTTRPTIQGIWQPDLAFPDFKIDHRS